MSEKHYVVEGATCKCQFGTAPDVLMVKTNKKEYANDINGARKLIASTKDTGGATLQKNTFGSCAKMNNSPCKPVVLQWQGFYDRVTLTNGGNPLLEDSKATCPIGGSGCIQITNHGQVAEVSTANVKKSNDDVMAQLLPVVDMKSALREILRTAGA
ncbi:DUF4280 domain-containing protein [Taibaiella chishuiensis]|uniref:Uncharacterized protein DUF4280 n=1 Tax=Taibaiella chishuiensis TaxID=1434707 RepID=A0A2P8D418_9BACT|nr:DUF4280 domain-containing protein [Taibaiella chishuiensis]PSK91957.1 uncharacterized protein DUF4280 [Taibaiella chishuiensis]